MSAPAGRKRAWRYALWGAGVAAAVAVHVAGILLFRVEGTVAETPRAPQPAFASLPPPSYGDDETLMLREFAFLFDTAPLFLPTRWNTAAAPRVAPLELRPPEVFDLFPARVSFAEADFGLGAIETQEPEPASVLPDVFGGAAIPLERGTAPVIRLSARFAFIEVRRFGDSEVVMTDVIALEGAPSSGRQIWAPAEFLVHIGPVGLLGDAVLLQGSGLDDVDQFLRDRVRELLREQIPEPGYFRIVAGP